MQLTENCSNRDFEEEYEGIPNCYHENDHIECIYQLASRGCDFGDFSVLDGCFDTEEDKEAFWISFRDRSTFNEFKKRTVYSNNVSWEIEVPIDFIDSRKTNVSVLRPRTKVDTSEVLEKSAILRGTREFSDHSVNIQVGCQSSCLYCWAAERAISSGQIKSREEWENEQIKSMYFKKGPIPFKKYDGVVMYPTTHDISKKYINTHIKAVKGLLGFGNELLICTKASLYCMEKIAEAAAPDLDKVTFMVTITTLDEAQSIFWEPNAPLPAERIAALKFLYHEGFSTSVLIEPLLQGPSSAMAIYEAVRPYVSDSIWIGTMNYVDTRVDVSIPENARAVEAIKKYHSIDNLRFLYNSMKDLPKVKFKNSISRIFEKKSE